MFNKRAVRIWEQFWNHKQVDTFGAGNAVGQARQNEVVDIFAKVIVGPADVNLLTCDRTGRSPFGAQPWTTRRQRRTRPVVRLGSSCRTMR